LYHCMHMCTHPDPVTMVQYALCDDQTHACTKGSPDARGEQQQERGSHTEPSSRSNAILPCRVAVRGTELAAVMHKTQAMARSDPTTFLVEDSMTFGLIPCEADLVTVQEACETPWTAAADKDQDDRCKLARVHSIYVVHPIFTALSFLLMHIFLSAPPCSQKFHHSSWPFLCMHLLELLPRLLHEQEWLCD